MENQVFYFYKVNEKTGRRQTIAGVVVNNSLRISSAECSNKDQFRKSKGRDIARGRALKSKNQEQVRVVNLREDVKPVQQFIELVK